jgi:hypothetical protein
MQRSGGSEFKANLGKQFVRPYLGKNPSLKRAVGVAQSVGLEFKHQYHKKKKGKKERKERT